MSSATPSNGSQSRALVNSLPGNAPELGMVAQTSVQDPARQRKLSRRWTYFRCTQYDGRSTAWDGGQATTPEQFDFIAHGGVVPAGFYDAGKTVSLRFRRPTAPYQLAKVIVNRFTSLLFSARRHPKIVCDDPKTEDWLTGFAEASRLWAAMIKARAFGGAMGSVGLSFKFSQGKPVIEVHDPRFSTPTFSDRSTFEVGHFEKRYLFQEPFRNADGEIEMRNYWYRRIITDEFDVVWPKVYADGADEPDWMRERYYGAELNFGFCPVVWVQNLPLEEDVDGDPDCQGIYEMIEAIDALYAQANMGTLANCDPTPIISSDAEIPEFAKGSANAMQLEKGASANLLEMTGGGIEKAMELAEKFEEKALTVARCTLDRNEGGPSRTAQEVEHNYSSMIEQADILREQYGEHGIKKLMEMVLRAAQQLNEARIVTDPETGLQKIVRELITLPKKKVVDPKTGVVSYAPRELGSGSQVELRWPEYFTPSFDEINKAVDAAGKAMKSYGLIDQKHASDFVAPFFQVENVPGMLAIIKEEAKEPGFGYDGGGDAASEVPSRDGGFGGEEDGGEQEV